MTALGELIELDVGPVAHGGHCVARLDDAPGGRVVFVRHTIPGERVRALVTEDAGGSFIRADAVEILRAAPSRVAPPCPHSGAGRCGGCDWQHVDPSAQRELKASVVREQFQRLAGLSVDAPVGALPGGPLGWRTRIGYTIDSRGRAGLLRHRSRAVESIESCPLGVSGVGDGPLFDRTWPGQARIEVVRADGGEVSVLAEPVAVDPPRRPQRGGRPRRARPTARPTLIEGAARQHHTIVAGGSAVDFEVDPGGFWQVHPAAAQTFVNAVLAGLAPKPGETVLDLYAGAGLFTAVLAHAVGPDGRVLGLEADAQAVADAALNLADVPWAEVQRASITGAVIEQLDLRPDLVVLDPPRSGAGRAVVEAVLTLAPRAIAYVACDPAALARDVRSATDGGWVLTDLAAFDAFPMTHHIECVAVLRPA